MDASARCDQATASYGNGLDASVKPKTPEQPCSLTIQIDFRDGSQHVQISKSALSHSYYILLSHNILKEGQLRSINRRDENRPVQIFISALAGRFW